MRKCRKCLALAVCFLMLAGVAHGVVKALLPLQTILKESQFIVVAKVDKLFADKPAMILNVDEDLKGKFDLRRLPVNLKGDAEATKGDDTAKLLKRLGPDLPVVLFIHYDKQKKLHSSFAYSNGTWFHLQKTGADTQAWSFTHCEPYLRRTYTGSTADMVQVVKETLAGKRLPPGIKKDELPGLGPELAK